MDGLTKGLLWSLGVLAVVWTVANVVMLAQMPGGCPMCAVMGRDQGGAGMTMPNNTVMGGAWMWWMMATTAITWIVMVALDAVFIFLVASRIYGRRSPTRP